MQSVCCSLFDMLQKFYFFFVQVRALKKILYVKIWRPQFNTLILEMSYIMFYKLWYKLHVHYCIVSAWTGLKRWMGLDHLVARISFFNGKYILSSWCLISLGNLSFSLHFVLKRVRGEIKTKEGREVTSTFTPIFNWWILRGVLFDRRLPSSTTYARPSKQARFVTM